jgi:hypothetical protein
MTTNNDNVDHVETKTTTTTITEKELDDTHSLTELSENESPSAGSVHSPTKSAEKKHVHFDNNVTASHAPLYTGGISPLNIDLPRKIYVGKAFPARDIAIALGILGFFMWCASDFQPEKYGPQTKVQSKHAHPEIWKQLASVLEQSAVASMNTIQQKSPPRTNPCPLFLHPSSIPGTGPGLFAGQDYDAGDEVISSLLSRIPFDVSSNSSESTWLLHPYAFLIKHHPILFNVQGTLMMAQDSKATDALIDNADDSRSNEWGTLRALRPIRAGEELFVAWSDHTQSLGLTHHDTASPPPFDYIPTEPDYATADAILVDVRSTGQRMQAAHRRRQVTLDIGYLFSLNHRTVLKFQPRVAALLPTSKKEGDARLYFPSTLYSALKNVTLLALQQSAHCLSDTRVASSTATKATNSEQGSVLVAARKLRKNDLVLPVPLSIRERGSEDELASDVKQAWMHGHQFALYALTDLERISSENESINNTANVELRWLGPEPKNDLRSYMNQPHGTLTMGVYALREIVKGEMVCVLLLICACVFNI